MKHWVDIGQTVIVRRLDPDEHYFDMGGLGEYLGMVGEVRAVHIHRKTGVVSINVEFPDDRPVSIDKRKSFAAHELQFYDVVRREYLDKDFTQRIEVFG